MNQFYFSPKHYLLLIVIVVATVISACTSFNAIKLYNDTNITEERIVKLILPVEIDVVYYNGQKHSFLPAYQQYVTYHLLEGNHLLGLQFQDIIKNEDGNEENIKSRVVMLRFNATSGETYTVNFEKPTTFAEFEQLENNLELSLSHNDQIIAHSSPEVETIISGWASNKMNRDTARIFNDDEYAKHNIPDDDAPAIEHLNYWWKIASKTEKHEFKQGITQEK